MVETACGDTCAHVKERIEDKTVTPGETVTRVGVTAVAVVVAADAQAKAAAPPAPAMTELK